MNRKRLQAVTAKEWLDMRKNKMVLIMMALLPLLMIGMILGTVYFMERIPDADFDPETGDSGMALPPELEALGYKDGVIILLNDQYMFYLLLIPLALPVYVAAYSIIGEKETRSLEPLLATPVSTTELLLGKIISAAAPAIVLTWLSFVLTAIGLYIIASPAIFAYWVRPVWSLSMAFQTPFLAVLSTACGVIASSRLNDPRAAQQVTAIFIIPLIGLSLVVLMGKVYLDMRVMGWATLLIAAITVGVVWLAVRLFQRETILTRWK